MEEKDKNKETIDLAAGLLVMGAIYTIGFIVGRLTHNNNSINAAYNKGVVDAFNYSINK